MKPALFHYMRKPAIEPRAGCPFADTMVLNPALVRDPVAENTLHMLFRSTGPWPQKRLPGKLDPYPIFLGYARSDDLGRTWEADFSRPALAPTLEYELEKLQIRDVEGQSVVNYANAQIEDPRIFPVEGQWYVSAACRLFPGGAYWTGERPITDYVPAWAATEDNPVGLVATRNATTSVLFRLDLSRLIRRDYGHAFSYVGPLTDGSICENRDVYLFPERMEVAGKLQYVLIHRPEQPDRFAVGKGIEKPAMFMAAAERLKDFVTGKAEHTLMATGIFDWESSRIGGSWPPLRISPREWLVSYHGRNETLGYSQSFMIMQDRENDFPKIMHRCPERLMVPARKWELPDKFGCPCLFTTGGVLVGDTLIMGYGAADQKAGIARVNLHDLVAYVRQFDAQGRTSRE